MRNSIATFLIAGALFATTAFAVGTTATRPPHKSQAEVTAPDKSAAKAIEETALR